MGVVSLIGLAVNANSISDLSKDQDSICTTVGLDQSCLNTLKYSNKINFLIILTTNFHVYINFQAKQLGGFTCTKSGTPTVTELGVCFDTLVAYTTPDC